MAGVVILGGGARPSTSSAGTGIWCPSSVNNLNGESLNNRVFGMPPTSGADLQLSDSRLLNFIRNGGFWFAQRQTPSSATTYSNTTGRALSADGWGITNENASATYTRVDTSGALNTGYQSRYYGEFLKTTSNGKLVISQVIEGSDAMALRNRAVRLQCWMRGVGGTQTIRMGVLYLSTAGTVDTMPATFVSAFGGAGVNPTFGTNLGLSATSSTSITDGGTTNGFGATCTVTTSWQRFGVTVVPGSSGDFKNLVVAFWSDSQITATQGIDIGQASLTDGHEIQDWSPQSYAVELNRCQRWFQKSFAVDSIPQTNNGVSTGEYHAIAGKAGAVANAGFIPVRMPVTMRASPGLTLYNPAAANAQVRDITGAVDHSASSVVSGAAGGHEFMVTSTGNAATAVGDSIAVHWSADAEI